MILDIVLIIILLISGFIGYKKGLVGVVLSIVSLILAIILAVFLQSTVASYLYNETAIGTMVESSIKTTIETEIENRLNSEVEEIDENKFIDMFFEPQELATTMVDESANKITMFILKGISFVGIFILVFIICYILRMILNIVFKLPILNSINKVGGVSLNVLKTVFKIWILLAIIYFVSFVPLVETINNFIDSSVVTKFLYENNIIVNILKSTLSI